MTLSEAYLLTLMETILYPFSTFTWFLILSMFAIANIIIQILSSYYKEKFKNPNAQTTLEVLQILLGMPGNFNPQRNVPRILNATWTFFALILRTFYQALIFHLIRTHVTRNIPQTMEELAEKNYCIITNKIGEETIDDITLFKNLDIIILNTTSEILPLIFLENLPHQEAKRSVTIAPLVVAQYYVNHFHKLGIFRQLPDILMNHGVCIYLSKHSFLVDQLNDLLIFAKSAGLLNAWYAAEIDLDFFKQDDISTDRIFGLQQLHMAFVILCCGYVMSLVAFIWEVLYKKYRYLKCFKM